MKFCGKIRWIWILMAVLLALFTACSGEEIPSETESYTEETTLVTAETEPPQLVHPTMTLNGNEITEFTFRYGDYVNPDAVQFFADYLTSAFGLTKGENGVIFDFSVAVKMKEQASTVIDGNNITITAGSNGGLEVVLEEIMALCTAQIPESPEDIETASVTLESCVEEAYAYTLFESAEPADSWKLIARTDKDPTSYKVGEEMKFYFELTSNGETIPCHEFRYSITADEGFQKTQLAPGEDGKFYFSCKLSKPGYIEVKITARGDKPTDSGVYYKGNLCTLAVTACANFDEIGTAYEEPANYDKFWADMLAELEGIDPKDTVVTEYLPGSEYGKDGYLVYHIEVPTNKKPAYGFLTLPDNAAPGSLGIRMNFIGYGIGKAGPNTHPDSISVTVCAHSIPCDIDQSDFDREFNRQNLHNYGLSRSDYNNPSNSYFGRMILRNVQALRFAETFPEWDGKNILATGASQGTFQSVALAALCPEVTELQLEIPWMCNVGMNHAGQIPSQLTPAYSKNVLYFDTVFFARRITGVTVTMKVGMTDTLAPITGTTALYNNFKGCTKTITLYQSAGHGNLSSKYTSYVKSSEGE